MYLSVVIPAYNESKFIARTIETARQALDEAGISPYEIIVADDHSTDDTAQIAREAGARVVDSGKRNIGGTRNVGAAVAQGTHLLFLDADTMIDPALLLAMLKAFDEGFVAGGATVSWSEPVPRWMERITKFWNWVSRVKRLPAGSFFFVRKDIFDQEGGFNEKFYFSEEIDLARRLKKKGRVEILKHVYLTSPRKANQFTLKEHRALLFKMILRPWGIHDRKYLDYWYTRRD